tara:strand:+ start:1229 stop:1360 length:132 start_codon:yes stop_codon:yes gene_type:complete
VLGIHKIDRYLVVSLLGFKGIINPLKLIVLENFGHVALEENPT